MHTDYLLEQLELWKSKFHLKAFELETTQKKLKRIMQGKVCIVLTVTVL